MAGKLEFSWFRKLTLDGKLSFCRELLPLLDVAATDPSLKPFLQAVNTDHEKFLSLSSKLSHPQHTEDVMEGDAIRDGGIASLKMNAQRATGRKDEAWVNAGKLILNAFNDFNPNMATLPINEETAAVDKLLAAIEANAELKQAVLTIQCGIWLDDIKSGQEMVKRSLTTRDAAKSTDISAYEASRMVETSFAKLFRYLNYKLEFEPTPALVTFSNEYDKLSMRYKKNISLQATLRDSIKKEES